MRIDFIITTDCDFREQTTGDTFEMVLHARDDENSEEYSKVALNGRRGEGGVADYVIAVFEHAIKEYSLFTDKQCGGVLRDETDAELAQVSIYETWKARRKRRYGYVRLTASVEWGYPLPWEPTVYSNPAMGSASHALIQMFFQNDFHPLNAAGTKKSIIEGANAAATTLDYYFKMARVFEEKTGEKIDFSAIADGRVA